MWVWYLMLALYPVIGLLIALSLIRLEPPRVAGDPARWLDQDASFAVMMMMVWPVVIGMMMGVGFGQLMMWLTERVRR